MCNKGVKMRGKIAKAIRKGCKNNDLPKEDYKVNKATYNGLNIETKKKIRNIIKGNKKQ